MKLNKKVFARSDYWTANVSRRYQQNKYIYIYLYFFDIYFFLFTYIAGNVMLNSTS